MVTINREIGSGINERQESQGGVDGADRESLRDLFRGDQGENQIDGDSEPNIIRGREGNDDLNGLGGDDFLKGG